MNDIARSCSERTAGRADLVRAVAERTGHSQEIADEIVRTFLSEVADALARGSRVELRRFGRLDTALRHARTNARNPRTGERVELPDRRVVKFRAGKQL